MLALISWPSLLLGAAGALSLFVDVLRVRAQHMASMCVVWPVTGLWDGPLERAAYSARGRSSAGGPPRHAHGSDHPRSRPFAARASAVAKAALHCGADWTLGDIIEGPPGAVMSCASTARACQVRGP